MVEARGNWSLRLDPIWRDLPQKAPSVRRRHQGRKSLPGPSVSMIANQSGPTLFPCDPSHDGVEHVAKHRLNVKDIGGRPQAPSHKFGKCEHRYRVQSNRALKHP
jgi:hypothetical protein